MKAQGCFLCRRFRVCHLSAASFLLRLHWRSSGRCWQNLPPEDPSKLIIPIRPILQGRDPAGSGAVMSYCSHTSIYFHNLSYTFLFAHGHSVGCRQMELRLQNIQLALFAVAAGQMTDTPTRIGPLNSNSLNTGNNYVFISHASLRANNAAGWVTPPTPSLCLSIPFCYFVLPTYAILLELSHLQDFRCKGWNPWIHMQLICKGLRPSSLVAQEIHGVHSVSRSAT